jgi:hypothetical protein
MAIAASFSFGSAAGASTLFTMTVNGTVKGVFDADNEFGGGDLTDLSFNAVFNAQLPSCSGCIESSRGGRRIATATLTIHGQSVSFNPAGFKTGDSSFHVGQEDPITGNWNDVEGNVEEKAGRSLGCVVANDDPSSPIVNSDLVTPVTYHAQPSDIAFCALSLDVGDWGILSIQTIDVSARESAAVPEPASWTVMIAGLGAVGAALRCRRSRARLA